MGVNRFSFCGDEWMDTSFDVRLFVRCFFSWVLSRGFWWLTFVLIRLTIRQFVMYVIGSFLWQLLSARVRGKGANQVDILTALRETWTWERAPNLLGTLL